MGIDCGSCAGCQPARLVYSAQGSLGAAVHLSGMPSQSRARTDVRLALHGCVPNPYCLSFLFASPCNQLCKRARKHVAGSHSQATDSGEGVSFLGAVRAARSRAHHPTTSLAQKTFKHCHEKRPLKRLPVPNNTLSVTNSQSFIQYRYMDSSSNTPSSTHRTAVLSRETNKTYSHVVLLQAWKTPLITLRKLYLVSLRTHILYLYDDILENYRMDTEHTYFILQRRSERRPGRRFGSSQRVETLSSPFRTLKG